MLHQESRLDEAAELYQWVLRGSPTHPDALHLLGVVYHQRGDHEEAIKWIGLALENAPGAADFHANLGTAQAALGRHADALDSFRRAIDHDPSHPTAHANLADTFHRIGDLGQALKHAQRAVEIAPSAQNWDRLADVLADCQENQAAISAFHQALMLDPHQPDTHNSLGNLLHRMGNHPGAEGAYRQAIALDPHHLAALSNLGMVLRELGQPTDAVNTLRRAVALAPGSAAVLNHLGLAHRDLGEVDEAAACFEQAIEASPATAEAYQNLAGIRLAQGRAADAVEVCERGLSVRPDSAKLHSVLLFARIFRPGDDPRSLAEEQVRWAARHADHLGYGAKPYANDRTPTRRLRVGYVSPNFRDHCQALFLTPLLEAHDKEQVEVVCYSDLARPDAITNRLRSHADTWRDTHRLSDDELADLIRQDQIDVLVDLTMHLADNRLLVFARRPAPVQVCWLAYPGSTGLAAMGYRISDSHLDPPGLFDHFYQETTVRLPGAFWCYDPLDSVTCVGAVPAESTKTITFGCLNNFAKVNLGVLRLWAAVLRAVPGSRLVVMAPEGVHRRQTWNFFASEGVDPDRVQFILFAPRREYLRRYHDIDIALDTLPANGHTTSLDALWMGVPVVTRVGDTVSGRAGLCQLTLLGLEELVARSDEDFIRIAADLASDLPRLVALRTSLRDRMQASPLMDSRRFARGMEAAFRAMWGRWCLGSSEESQQRLSQSSTNTGIPRKLHQTWKTANLPPRYAAFADGWRYHHPGWEYTLWTDADLRQLVAQRYPDFLPTFDSYVDPICRADLGRYLVLHAHGGVYADLDCECLKPVDALLSAGGVVLAAEPAEHAAGGAAAQRGLTSIPGNAFLASEPGHRFWDRVFAATTACAGLPDPLDATGPFLLARVLGDPSAATEVTVLPADLVYPLTREECHNGSAYDLETWAAKTEGAHVVHHWDGTWFNHPVSGSGLPAQPPMTVHNGHLPSASLNLANGNLKVCCVMATVDRAEHVHRAVAGFLGQTYPHRELVICTNRPNPELIALADNHAGNGVRLLVHPDPAAGPGALRNAAIATTDAELVCVWDDDDLHDPARLTVQVKALRETGSAACFLERLVLWHPDRNRLGISVRRAWEGTLLAIRCTLPRYPDLPCREDTPVIDNLLRDHRVVTVDLPRLYTYVFHGVNTTDPAQLERWWETATARYVGPLYRSILRELVRRFPAEAVPPSASGPLVSCLMVTRGRGRMAATAVDCFRAQTYPHRELVVITEFLDPVLADHLNRIADPRIRVVVVGDVGLKLGELRNRAVAAARGEYVCQWDDDDLSDPDRLSAQIAALERTGTDGCVLERWTLYWPKEGRLAVSGYRDWEGSLLARRDALPEYPPLGKGEDTPTVLGLARRGRLARLDRPDLYVYVVHGENTFYPGHFTAMWTTASERFEGDQFTSRWHLLRRRLPGLPDPLHRVVRT